MSDWLKVWKPEDVKNAPTYVEQCNAWFNYAQQRLGVPYPTVSDMAIARRKIKLLFKQYPGADWLTLCRLVDYCKARKARPRRIWSVVDKQREAWAAGFVPELDFNYAAPAPELDDELRIALEVETHPWWRRRMVMAQSPGEKRRVLAEWSKEKTSSTSH